MSVHDGHRERLKEQFSEHGLGAMPDHNVLELLLFYAIPRGDVNPLAHDLVDRFGSLAAVFDAPIEKLMSVPGVGENTARLIKLIPQVSRRYLISRAKYDGILSSPAAAGRYLLPYFYAERDEVVYLVCLDGKRQVLACRCLFRGSVNSANVSVRKLVETALSCNAASVILAHNHPSGIAVPSREDEATTRRIMAALDAVEIELADHIVVADDDFVSMADSGFFKRL